ncbi:MAG TPA: VWA domain-containing protein [Aggregatilineales bacterium]|nr:VWA domain-containing protein [Aggregatilineales bacterium]
MNNKGWSRVLTVMLVLALAVVACDVGSSTDSATPLPAATDTPPIPEDAIEISIIYAPESDLYLKTAIEDFNRAYREGRNPLTGEPLADSENPIFVTGRSGSSGTVMQGIVNAFIAPNNVNVERPTIFAPSVSHWLALANFQAGREVFDLANSPATANAPVVMAIWKSRLDAIQQAHPDDQIGWSHLLEVLNNPEGWAAYGIGGDRKTVYYGHTDPFISSTALSTLIAEYVASADANGIQERRLSLDTVTNADVQQGVRNIENLIRHYSQRTTEFKEYIAQGPEYLDFVALEENDLIFINQGKTEYQPPEPLVALYPAEGTFWHEHPFAIPQADWVSDEQAEAARIFTEYILSPVVQEQVMANGFRPVNPAVPIGYPISPDLGVDPDQPLTVLEVPDPAVISAVQESWSFVKKQADIWLVIDISGSMFGDKLDEAKKAAVNFIDQTEPRNRVGLITFNRGTQVVVPLDVVETNSNDLKNAINRLQADGDTALYDAVVQSIDLMARDDSNDRIQAVILLSDGANTVDNRTRQEAVDRITAERQAQNPVVVIPIAYGADADISILNAFARAGNTRVQSGNPDEIRLLLELISSYF